MCRRRWALFLAILLVGIAVACQGPIGRQPSTVHLKARPWPAADGLFRQDPRWLGADDAHSVDLGKGRVLWLFGDTLVRAGKGNDRSQSHLIHNSVGIQTGSDPAAASMVFSWRQTAAHAPASFFPEFEKTWFWPGDGIRLGGRLLVFLTMIAPFENDLGFAVTGWHAQLVDNPDSPPDRWQTADVRKNPGMFAIALGTGGVLHSKGYLYAYGTHPSGNQAYLARWKADLAWAGDLRGPQWWCGAGQGWKTEAQMDSWPAVLFTDAHAEFGVHFEPRINQFVQIQTVGFGAAELGWRIAPRPEGPWGRLTGFYSPEEVTIPGVLIYAAKSHPFLAGADLVITYATNHIDPKRLNEYPALYYPRVLQGSFDAASGLD
ncbi:DUF4185 domain-containing protein [Desulfosarcina sp.]|uniref:DUF4185 domain-containing protein n=1 Tax=Desulfosarcina sp. TaxID=2027861 RepID=UPI003562CE0D